MSQTCCNRQWTDPEYAVHITTGIHAEIAALRAEVERLRAGLQWIAAETEGSDLLSGINHCARAALKEWEEANK